MTMTIKLWKVALIAGTILAAILLPLFYLALRGNILVPNAIIIGPFSIHFYAISILTGAVVAVLVAEYLIKSEPFLADADVWGALLWALVPGLIGARLLHVATEWPIYSAAPQQIFAVWNGGLAIWGGVAGGALGLFAWSRYNKISFESAAGLAATVLPLAQAIGRWGNFFNRELFGPPTDLPWGIFIPVKQNPYPDLQSFQFFHPLFLYESILNAILFAALYRAYRRGMRGRKAIIAYVLGYGAIRFTLDSMRLDGSRYFLNLTPAQLMIAVMYATIGLYLLYLKLSARKHD